MSAYQRSEQVESGWTVSFHSRTNCGGDRPLYQQNKKTNRLSDCITIDNQVSQFPMENIILYIHLTVTIESSSRFGFLPIHLDKSPVLLALNNCPAALPRWLMCRDLCIRYWLGTWAEVRALFFSINLFQNKFLIFCMTATTCQSM